MQLNNKRVKMAPPMLEAIRPDAIQPSGILKDKIDELVELAKACNNDIIAEKILLVEGKWLLTNDSNKELWQEPQSIYDNPKLCLKSLNNTLLSARRYRCKATLIKLLNYAEDIYNEIYKEENKEIFLNLVDQIGVELLEFSLELFKLASKPFLMEMISRIQRNMFDYAGFIQNLPVVAASCPKLPDGAPKNKATKAYYQSRHERAYGENIASGVKSAALNYTCTGLVRDVDSVLRGIKLLDKYHGTIHGAYTAADFLAGRSPNAPTNINAACKYFIALQKLMAVSDSLVLANRMETIACNLLPAYFNKEEIQIMQCTNQCNINKKNRPWPYAKVKSAEFAKAEDNCEAIENLLDATDTLRRSLWMKKAGNGIALIFPFASTVLHMVDGKAVQLTVSGEYPYGENVEIKIQTKEAISFPIYIRIPGYTTGATVAVNKEAPQPAVSDSYYVLSRKFKKDDTIKIHIPMAIKINRFYRRSCSVFKGPIIMVFPQSEKAKFYDNYALDMQSSPSFIEDSHNIMASAFKFEEEYDNNSKIALMPECDTENHVDIELVPYCNTVARIAQFATINLDEAKADQEFKTQ